jgi:hypothetical protein
MRGRGRKRRNETSGANIEKKTRRRVTSDPVLEMQAFPLPVPFPPSLVELAGLYDDNAPLGAVLEVQRVGAAQGQAGARGIRGGLA